MRRDHFIEAGDTREIGAQASLFPTRQIESPANSGFAQVRIHQQSSITQLRKRYGQVDRRGRLSFARQRACHQNYLRRMFRLRKQQGSPQRAKRLGNLRFRLHVGKQLNARARGRWRRGTTM